MKRLNLKHPDHLLICTTTVIIATCFIGQLTTLLKTNTYPPLTKSAIEEQIENNTLAKKISKDLVQSAKNKLGWHTNGIIRSKGTSYYIKDLQHLTNRTNYTQGNKSPYQTILNYRDLLQAENIQLIITIINGKGNLTNPATNALVSKLKQQNIPTIHVKKEPLNQYLQHDSHWHPDLMEKTAQLLAKISKKYVSSNPFPYEETTQTITNTGDLIQQNQPELHTQTINIRTVRPTNTTPLPPSQILILGDSFTNIFSAPEMGWGQKAGLAERLSFHLSHPCKAIAINGNGANASRQELARTTKTLPSIKLVIWQFAARELDHSPWQNTPIKFHPPSETQPIKTKIYKYKILTIPKWNLNTPYPNSITEILIKRQSDGKEFLIRMLLKKNHQYTETKKLTEGQTLKLKITPWEKVKPNHKKSQLYSLNRYDLNPYWAEPQHSK